jgi:hypothetical protein
VAVYVHWVSAVYAAPDQKCFLPSAFEMCIGLALFIKRCNGFKQQNLYGSFWDLLVGTAPGVLDRMRTLDIRRTGADVHVS